jgi:hypothetical protein
MQRSGDDLIVKMHKGDRIAKSMICSGAVNCRGCYKSYDSEFCKTPKHIVCMLTYMHVLGGPTITVELDAMRDTDRVKSPSFVNTRNGRRKTCGGE